MATKKLTKNALIVIMTIPKAAMTSAAIDALKKDFEVAGVRLIVVIYADNSAARPALEWEPA